MLVLEEWVIACRVRLTLHRWTWSVRMERCCHLIAIRCHMVNLSVGIILRGWVSRVIYIQSLVAIWRGVELLLRCGQCICLGWTLRVYNESSVDLASEILILSRGWHCGILRRFWSIQRPTFWLVPLSLLQSDNSSKRKLGTLTATDKVIVDDLF